MITKKYYLNIILILRVKKVDKDNLLSCKNQKNNVSLKEFKGVLEPVLIERMKYHGLSKNTLWRCGVICINATYIKKRFMDRFHD